MGSLKGQVASARCGGAVRQLASRHRQGRAGALPDCRRILAGPAGICHSDARSVSRALELPCLHE